MKNEMNRRTGGSNCLKGWKMAGQLAKARGWLPVALFLLLAFTGCQAPMPQFSPEMLGDSTSAKSESIVLREGDSVSITFPGNPGLNVVGQQIRRDGRITLPDNKGEFQAAGLTPSEMEKKLLEKYSDLVDKRVTVSAISAFPIFVTGCVLKPGKILEDRPVTVLEAILEAGGPDITKANMKKVKVIRKEDDGHTKNYELNLKNTLQGKGTDQFYLKPHDIVYVPERFIWF
jgi:protein involved in polysaccharide export with SLBB domain